MVTTVNNVLGSGGSSGGIVGSDVLERGSGVFAGNGGTTTITITDVGSMNYNFVPVPTGDISDTGDVGEIMVEKISVGE